MVSNPNQVCIKNKCFMVELAKSQQEKSRGLMGREYLAKSRGMLFIYEREEEYSFWMKNTLIPLDIVWIDKDQKIVYIYKNAQPCKEECESIKPEKKSMYILEVNAGEANFNIGDKVEFNFK